MSERRPPSSMYQERNTSESPTTDCESLCLRSERVMVASSSPRSLAPPSSSANSSGFGSMMLSAPSVRRGEPVSRRLLYI